jgi:peptide/nickel transport system substrate-binding protein
VPELAESWEATPDAKKWIFKLRKGVEFHDGKSMDADDVIYSLNWHRKEGTKSAAKPLVESIVSMKKEDKYTLVFEMAQR